MAIFIKMMFQQPNTNSMPIVQKSMITFSSSRNVTKGMRDHRHFLKE